MKAHSLLIGAAALAVVISPLAAQTAPSEAPVPPAQGGSHPKGGGKKGGKLAAKLGLTREQVATIAPLVQKNRSDIRAIRDDASLTKQQKHEQISAIHQAMDQKMKTILTPEQYQKWQEMKARPKDKAQKGQPTA